MKKYLSLILFFSFTITLQAATLTLDAPKLSIQQAFGTPEAIQLGPVFDLWYYQNNNYLILYRSKLKGYSDATDLSLDLRPKKPSKAKWLTTDSTPDDVLSVLGTPRKITPGNLYEIWWYDNAFIKFLKGHIMEYADGQRLKFDFTKRPLPQPPKTLGEFTKTSEVIALKGTPSHYRRGVEYDTWWYNEDVMLVQGNNLHYVDKHPYKTPKGPTPNYLTKEDPVMNRLHYKNTPPLKLPLRIDIPQLEERNLNDWED